MTTQEDPTSRALRYLLDNGVPAHIAQAALTLQASEIAMIQRKIHDAQRPHFHMGMPCRPTTYQCGVAAVIDHIDPSKQETP